MRACPRVLVPLLLAIGCQDHPPTAVVSAMAADATTLARVTHFRLSALRGDASKYDRVFPRDAFLHPGSLTFQDASDGDDRTMLRVRFEGYDQDPATPGAAPIIGNSARLPFVKEKTKLLRLGLSRECLDRTCASVDLTCRHGECVPDQIDDPDTELPDAPSGDDGDTLDPGQFDDLPPSAGQSGAGGSAGAGGQGGLSGRSGQGGVTGQGGAAGQPGGAGQGGAGQGGAGQAAAGPGGGAGQGGAGQAGVAGQGGLSGSSGQGGAGQGGAGQGGNAGQGGAGSQAVVTALVSRGHHTCAQLKDGRLKCWGLNTSGQLGLGDTKNRGTAPGQMGNQLPAVDLGSSPVAWLSPGTAHTCALFQDTTVACWGDNSRGQLGLGDISPRGVSPGQMGKNIAKVVLGGPAFDLTSGNQHVCARVGEKQTLCWGDNQYGQLGRGDTTPRGGKGTDLPLGTHVMGDPSGPVPSDRPLPPASDWTCVQVASGLRCWGRNDGGQLGLGSTGNRGDAPNEMSESSLVCDVTGETKTQVEQIAVGGSHSCAIASGSVKCWGGNAHGQLGLGDTVVRGDGANEMGNSLPPVPVTALGVPVQVVAGDEHSCVLFDSGRVSCWGRGADGRLGTGSTASVGDSGGPTGVTFPILDLGAGLKATQLAAGSGHTCALLDSGRVKCWGQNSNGELGLGDTVPRGDQPGEMGDDLPYVDLGSSL